MTANLPDSLPALTAEECRQLDEIMVKKYGYSPLQMIECAGIQVANLVRLELKNDLVGKRILIFCGKGHNGADGFVAARHLSNWGAEVAIILCSDPNDLKGAPKKCYDMLVPLPVMRVQDHEIDCEAECNQADLIVDAMLGTGLNQDPKPPYDTLISSINKTSTPVISVDCPSGLDATTGKPGSPTVKADTTITFAVPKTGFQEPDAKSVLGKLVLADIGVPPALFGDLGVHIDPIFARFPMISIALDTQGTPP